MLFERAVSQPVSNWNISDEKFMFQECATDRHIWLVKLKPDSTPFIYKIALPTDVVEDPKKVNTFWNAKKKRMVIPIEEPLDHLEVDDEQGPGNNLLRTLVEMTKQDERTVEKLAMSEMDEYKMMRDRGELKGKSVKISPKMFDNQ